MDSKKYIGMDVHKESISIAVRNAAGKIVMECVIETKASMILQFIDGLRGDLQVTFEEGTSASWLYDLLKPHVTKLVVCDPRKNASMREGNQSDKIDARRLADLLRLNHLHPVYHGDHGLRSHSRHYLGNRLREFENKTRNREEAADSGPASHQERFPTVRGETGAK
jgi:transposase